MKKIAKEFSAKTLTQPPQVSENTGWKTIPDQSSNFENYEVQSSSVASSTNSESFSESTDSMQTVNDVTTGICWPE